MIKIRLNMNLLNYLKGTILTFTKRNKLTSFWKRRIKDSAIDNCVTVLEDEVKIDPLKDSYNGVPIIKEDPKEYYNDMAKEVEKEVEKEEKQKKRIKKLNKRNV